MKRILVRGHQVEQTALCPVAHHVMATEPPPPASVCVRVLRSSLRGPARQERALGPRCRLKRRHEAAFFHAAQGCQDRWREHSIAEGRCHL